ncbi:hypothetical protein L1987_18627 [Smallanthus sonchifolius]|uniref:Uncharacterized protein n=1 Tax=Smallanthus sonchifolius TaxID=185202 RepID=A0ACB9J0L1_9ASTR|nr:hypothetical protein L1987_18627 [Smallanthus sonchifolius]
MNTLISAGIAAEDAGDQTVVAGTHLYRTLSIRRPSGTLDTVVPGPDTVMPSEQLSYILCIGQHGRVPD